MIKIPWAYLFIQTNLDLFVGAAATARGSPKLKNIFEKIKNLI